MRKYFRYGAGVIFIVALCAGFLGTKASANENDRQRIILEMFEVMQYGKVIDQIAAVVGQQVTAEIKSKVPNIPTHLLEETGSITREEFSKLKPDMMSFVGVFMVENFSEAELVQLLEFYKSPIGKKSLTIMPKMTQEMMAWVPSVTDKFAQKTMIRVKALLKAQGYQL